MQGPSRLQDLVDAWDTSRRELLAGRIDSLLAARERRLILRMADEEGLLDDVVAAIRVASALKRVPSR